MMRTPEGQPLVTQRQMSQLEAVLGSKARSGQQFDAWDAAYGPIGEDGYPERLWDRRTDRQKRRRVLARQWLRPHLLPQDPLGEDWHLSRGEDARLCRRHGQPLSQPRRILDGAGSIEAEEPG